jgi:4-amino-4-deoxy-L-arabinose transferase-like glycosyltransferase
MAREDSAVPHKQPPRISRGAGVLLALLVVVHAVLALTSLRRNSVTIDEFSHLPAGLTYWQKGTFALYHHNPPLVKLLAALPVLVDRPIVDYGGSWERARLAGSPPGHVEFAVEFMHANAGSYFDLFNRARSVIVLLSIAGGLLVFLWARDLWGEGGGLLASALWWLDPNILAHAGVVTTDIGATVAMLGATYAFWRWARAPAWRGALLAGAALGCAEVVKFSALLLYLLFPILLSVQVLARRRALNGRSIAGQAASIAALSVLLINAVYLF